MISGISAGIKAGSKISKAKILKDQKERAKDKKGRNKKRKMIGGKPVVGVKSPARYVGPKKGERPAKPPTPKAVNKKAQAARNKKARARRARK